MELMEESVICGIRGDHTEVRNVSSSGLQGTDEGRDHSNAIYSLSSKMGISSVQPKDRTRAAMTLARVESVMGAAWMK